MQEYPGLLSLRGGGGGHSGELGDFLDAPRVVRSGLASKAVNPHPRVAAGGGIESTSLCISSCTVLYFLTEILWTSWASLK